MPREASQETQAALEAAAAAFEEWKAQQLQQLDADKQELMEKAAAKQEAAAQRVTAGERPQDEQQQQQQQQQEEEHEEGEAATNGKQQQHGDEGDAEMQAADEAAAEGQDAAEGEAVACGECWHVRGGGFGTIEIAGAVPAWWTVMCSITGCGGTHLDAVAVPSHLPICALLPA
jgi:hypothetical protein